jgi:hypothetical protein
MREETEVMKESHIFRVNGDYSPPEKETLVDPGCPASFEITSLSVLTEGAEANAGEVLWVDITWMMDEGMLDSDFLLELEDMALENIKEKKDPDDQRDQERELRSLREEDEE